MVKIFSPAPARLIRKKTCTNIIGHCAVLQDEGTRLRKLAMSDTISSTPSASQQASVTMATPASAFPPVIYIIAAIIIGLFIGKLIL